MPERRHRQAGKVKTSVLAGIAFVLVFLGAVIFSTIGMNQARCEVCITYQGRQACRTAQAATKEQAERTARENACAQIASGVTDSIGCQNTKPDSVRFLR